MPTLYIHIGHEKTGTTAIQNFCFDNRDELKSEGLLYPIIGYQDFVQSSLVNCIHHLDNNGKYLEFFPPGESIDSNAIWGELVKKSIEWGGDVLISSEHFISRLDKKGIEFIRRYLSKNLPEYKIKIVVFLRRQDECFVSRLSTLSKAGASKPFKHWKKEVLSKSLYYDYCKLLDLWAEGFGEDALILKNYRKGSDVRDEIQSVLGINIDTKTTARNNTSWSPLVVHLGLYFNELCSHMNVNVRRDKLNKINNAIINSESLSEVSKNNSLISFETAQNILSTYAETNMQLAKKYNGNMPFFDESIDESNYNVELDELSISNINKILFRVI